MRSVGNPIRVAQKACNASGQKEDATKGDVCSIGDPTRVARKCAAHTYAYRHVGTSYLHVYDNTD